MKVLHHDSVEPTWTVPKSKEPGHMRWLTNYVGGKPGTINVNPDVAAYSDNVCLGLMSVPVGNRQFGLHAHSVSENYVVVKGQVISWDGNGHEDILNVGDFCPIPEKSYHAFGNAGLEEAMIIWLHDKLEMNGTSIYTEETLIECPPVNCVYLNKLVPDWNDYKAKEPGFMRWNVSYLGGENSIDYNPGKSAPNKYVNVGLLGLLPDNRQPKHKNDVDVIYVVLDGRVMVTGEDGTEEVLEHTDCVRVPAGEEYSLRNLSGCTARVVWMHETKSDPSKIVYTE